MPLYTGGPNPNISDGLFLIDLGASLLLLSPASLSCVERQPVDKSSEGDSAPQHLIDEVVIPLLRDIGRLLSMLILLGGDAQHSKASIASRTELSHLWISEASYTQILADTYSVIFADDSMENLMRETFGFTFTEALDVIQAVQLEYRARMETHWEEIRQAGFSNEKEKALSEAGMRRMVEYTQTMALPPSVDEATFDVESLLTHIDLEEDTVRLVLDECSFDYRQRTPADVKQLLLNGIKPVAGHPFHREGARYLLINEALMLPGLKTRIEEKLRNHPLYAEVKGHTLEDLVELCFVQFFGDEAVCPQVHYLSKDNQRGEIDLLIRNGDIALIVEVKSGSLRDPEKKNHPGSFTRKINASITKASKQIHQAAEAILLDGGFYSLKKEWLDLASIREVHTIIVTLDDLLELGTNQLSLEEVDLLKHGGTLPWIVSYNDLSLLLEMVEEPGELIAYLRRRTSADIVSRYWSTDELDLFLEFRETGMWVEVDRSVDNVGAELSPAPVVMVPSRTALVDAWFYGYATKPKIKNVPMLPYVQQARQQGFEQWLALGADLLSTAEDVQEDLWGVMEKLEQMAVQDGRSHSFTSVLVGQAIDQVTLLTVYTGGILDNSQKKDAEIREYLAMKKTQVGAQRAYGMRFKKGKLISVAYDAETYDPAEFDQEKYSRLKPPPSDFLR